MSWGHVWAHKVTDLFNWRDGSIFRECIHSVVKIHSKIIISFSPPPTHSGFLLLNPRAVNTFSSSICRSEGAHYNLTYPHITSLTRGKTKPIWHQFHSQAMSPVTSDLRCLICGLRNHFAIYTGPSALFIVCSSHLFPFSFPSCSRGHLKTALRYSDVMLLTSFELKQHHNGVTQQQLRPSDSSISMHS